MSKPSEKQAPRVVMESMAVANSPQVGGDLKHRKISTPNSPLVGAALKKKKNSGPKPQSSLAAKPDTNQNSTQVCTI